jgi:hypothetical protein
MSILGVWRSWVVVIFFLALAAGQAANAQEREGVHVRARTGLAFPQGGFKGIFDAGPTFGFDVGYPLHDLIDLTVNYDAHIVNNRDSSTPMKYQVGLEGDLLGGRIEGFGLVARAGAGFTRFNSHLFTPTAPLGTSDTPAPDAPGRTYFTGSGGLLLAFDTGDDFTVWVGAGLSYAGLPDSDTALLNNYQHQPNEISDLSTDGTFTATNLKPESLKIYTLEIGFSLSPWR